MTTVAIRDDVSLVLVTGPPGGGKSTFARQMASRLSDEWRVMHLDDFFGPISTIQTTVQYPHLWPRMLAHPEIPGLSIGRYIGEGGKVLVEGIILGDCYADAFCNFAGMRLTDSRVRVIDLHCSRAEAIRRMTARHVGPKAGFHPGGHYDFLRPYSTVSVAKRVVTDGMDPETALIAAVETINEDK